MLTARSCSYDHRYLVNGKDPEAPLTFLRDTLIGTAQFPSPSLETSSQVQLLPYCERQPSSDS